MGFKKQGQKDSKQTKWEKKTVGRKAWERERESDSICDQEKVLEERDCG